MLRGIKQVSISHKHTHTLSPLSGKGRRLCYFSVPACLSDWLKENRFWLVGCWTNRRVRMTSSQSLESRPPSRSHYWDTSTGKRWLVQAMPVKFKNTLWKLCCVSLSLSSKTDRAAKGSECFQRSLTLNPFLWSPFQNLCHLGNIHAHTHIQLYTHIHILMHVNMSLYQERSQIQSRCSDCHLSRTLP